MPTKKDLNTYLVKKPFRLITGESLKTGDKIKIIDNKIYRGNEFIMSLDSFNFFNKKHGFAKRA